MTRIRRMAKDDKSAKIRLISVIRVLLKSVFNYIKKIVIIKKILFYLHIVFIFALRKINQNHLTRYNTDK